jgi:hypothetical protein
MKCLDFAIAGSGGAIGLYLQTVSSNFQIPSEHDRKISSLIATSAAFGMQEEAVPLTTIIRDFLDDKKEEQQHRQ